MPTESSYYTLIISDIPVVVRHREIKNLHVGVYPPDGRVRVSAPLHLDADAVRLALVSRVSWIRRRREEFLSQERQTAREYISGESHYFMGKRYRLDVVMKESSYRSISVAVRGNDVIKLYVPANTDRATRERAMARWYRGQLKDLVPPLRERWEREIGVAADEVRIKKMKTKWGSCNIDARRIWLNLELVKKPYRCIEYILVHELVHLLERRHNDRFRSLINMHLPDWRLRREELNSAPLAHEKWDY